MSSTVLSSTSTSSSSSSSSFRCRTTRLTALRLLVVVSILLLVAAAVSVSVVSSFSLSVLPLSGSRSRLSGRPHFDPRDSLLRLEKEEEEEGHSLTILKASSSSGSSSSSSSSSNSNINRIGSSRRPLYSTLTPIDETQTTTKTLKKININGDNNNKGNEEDENDGDADDERKLLREQQEREQRSDRAKKTWSTIALQPTHNIKQTINLLQENNENEEETGNTVKVYNHELFHEFCTTIKGTYYINGLSSCEIGDRLIHPFEAHGYCKSFVFDGLGNMDMTCRIVETPLTKKELAQQPQPRILNRGVMSTIAPIDTLWGNIQNAISSQERDTANLTSDLWPRPRTTSTSTTTTSETSDNIDPVLIVCTDNGEPYALDPQTLETKGRLSEVIPKLKEIFDPPDAPPNPLGKGNKFLAHARYDEEQHLFIMCINTMIIPGDNFQGQSKMEFLEFNDNFDLVSRTSHLTDRFMVFHDWALTKNYYVIPKNPASLKWKNILKFSFGMSLGTDVFEMDEDSNGEFILLPRRRPNDEKKENHKNVHGHDKVNENGAIEIKTDSFFNCFHFGPCFETSTNNSQNEDNELVINGCLFDYYTFGGEMGFKCIDQEFDPIQWGSYGEKRPSTNGHLLMDESSNNTDNKDDAPSIPMSPPPKLDQFVINTTTKQLVSRTRIPHLIPVDMPQFNGDARPLQYSYFLGASREEGWFPFRQIVKLNLETYENWIYDAGDHQVVSEPMFVPRPNNNKNNNDIEDDDDDDGFLLSIVHNADLKQTKLMIWDTKLFEQQPQPAPIGEIYFHDVLFPWCVHGNFYPEYTP